ncbi:hypothetical protein LCGC14_0194330 [marine sediment metagenome]|uniref:Uncharacterized protein n=1 Tax=marine sediment metagenome TaxID=412755 RepID=A0A0F9X439_9ZZZZ|nr:hypothetical protein [bacterium]
MTEETDSTKEKEITKLEKIWYLFAKMILITFFTANVLVAYELITGNSDWDATLLPGLKFSTVAYMGLGIAIMIVVLYIALEIILPRIPESIMARYEAIPEKETLVGGGIFAYLGIMMASAGWWYIGAPAIVVILWIYIFFAQRTLRVARSRAKIPEYREELIETFNHLYGLEKKPDIATEAEMIELNRLVAKLNERVGIV